MTIRSAVPADRLAIARICLRTGAAGGDATGEHSDQTMLSDVYSTPYLDGPGGFALVWDEGEGPLGYILGTSDTETFQEWFTREWWPSVGASHRETNDADRKLLASATNPRRMLNSELGNYPAHLHIDLLPEAQGRGAGRALIEAACTLLADRGVPGVHLEVDPANAGALAFYPRVGFHSAAEGDGGPVFYRRLALAE
ncbi:GNAT family N-acetyltransferase [Demequina aurantiaca]|uniref:GNAT family N-acetyltransferase n=1 Tax=Demequina aurantiaca TaxID=676200 RepID=UPI00078043EB|nr:GNAT family N-acetyltransferase [Demequina aurantiaca]